VAVSNVELRVDAKSAVAQLNRASAATNKLDNAVRNMNGRLRDSRTRFAASGNAAKQASSQFNNLKQAIAGIGLAALAKQVLGNAAQFEQLQLRIKTLSQEYGEFERIQSFITKSSKQFGQSQAEAAQGIADVYARLRPLGIELSDIETVYKGFTATAIASGTSAAAASGAFLQLSQALGSGRLQGDEFRSIAEQVPGILQLVSKEMGVTVGELKKLGSDGKITSDILINALAKGFELNKGKIDEILQNSPAQKFKDFQNAVSELSNAVGSELLPVVTPLVAKATELLKTFGDLPRPIKTVGVVSAGAAVSVGLLSSAFGALGISVSGLAGGLLSKAALGLATLGGGATTVATGWTVAGAAITKTTVAVKAATVSMGLFAAAIPTALVVGLGLAFKEAADKKREFDEALRSQEPEVLDTKINELTNSHKELTAALAALQATPWYRGQAGDIADIQQRIDALDKQIDQATRRRELIVGLRVVADDIAADVRAQALAAGGVSKGFDTLTDKEIQEALGLAGVISSRDGTTTKNKTKRADMSEAMLALLQKRRELELSSDRFGKLAVDRQIRLQQIMEANMLPIERQNAIEEANFIRQQGINEIFKERANLLLAQVKGAQQLATNMAGLALEEQNKTLIAQQEKMDQFYRSIGDSIQTGIVDSLTAAVEGTKSLAEVASDTLRSLANIMLKFGLQTFLSGLGGKDGVGFFSKLFGGGKASGGTVKGGTSYLVGERGPELFTPGRTGSIAPNNSMGGANVTVNVDASGSRAQGDNANASQLGKAIGAAVQAELIKQQRPGGLLAR
jgi:tape measure domain-containing protein